MKFPPQSPINVVLVEPEIPANTGNIIRLCANTGANLYIVGPLGFELDDSKMKRAGLDYHEMCNFKFYDSWKDFNKTEKPNNRICYGITKKGKTTIYENNIEQNSWFFFGSETRGLSNSLRNSFLPSNLLQIPMQNNSRSLNLSNAVAVCVYEIWRRSSIKL